MSLKAFKSAVRVGMQIGVLDHWLERHRHTVRTVTKVQGNGFFFTQDGDAKRYWCDFPKSSALQFNGATAQIAMEGKHWTLCLTPNGQLDHCLWEKSRGNENECDAERRIAEEAQAKGADMGVWWDQWFERSDEWRDEIGHDLEAGDRDVEDVPFIGSVPSTDEDAGPQHS